MHVSHHAFTRFTPKVEVEVEVKALAMGERGPARAVCRRLRPVRGRHRAEIRRRDANALDARGGGSGARA